MRKIYTCPILKTDIAVTDMKRTLEFIDTNLKELKGKYVCVSNVHTTVMSYKEPEYRKVQNGAVLALPDGKPLSVVSRRRGFRDARRVPGPDLMTEVLKQSASKGYRHFFYGSTQDTLDKLKGVLEKEYPGINIVGMYSPPFRPLTPQEDEADVKMINDTNPDFVWVGLGAPKQEYWMAEHENRVNGLMIGVGAGFDFHAGTAKRAPKWIQELCLEWLYRLLHNPRRLLKRYATTNLFFIFNTSKESRSVKKQIRRDHRKVAMIGHKRIPGREGGVEIVVAELARRMVNNGLFIDAYNRRASRNANRRYKAEVGKNYEGIRIITIPTSQSKTLNAILYSYLATFRSLFGRYDVIHYHAEGPCITLPIAHFFGKKTVATIHGLDWQRSKWGNFATRMLKFGEKCAAKYADEIIVLSRNVQEYFEETYNRKTLFIPNGIGAPNLLEPDLIKERFGLEKDSYFLFLARIVPEKGAHYLIDAYSKLYSENPDLPRKKLVIAGGNSHSASYFEQLRNQAAHNDNIIFTDFVDGDVLKEIYSNAYAFVLPSDIEGMSMSLLEAMSYGRCCLVSDIKENTEVVEDHGLKFKKSDVEDLKEQLKKLIIDPKCQNDLASGAAEFITKKYNWDDVTQKTIDVYHQLIKK